MSALYWFESIRNPVLTAIMSVITYLGHEILPVAVICLLYWCINKRTAYKMAFALFFSCLAAQGLKVHFRIERPWVIDPDFKPVESAVGAATGYSFPSGHTQAATALYGTLAMCLKKWWQKAICIVLMLAIGVSRLYLGVHTPKDVIVALVMTLIITVVVCLIIDRIYDKPKYDVILMIIMLVASVAVMAYAVILLKGEIITYANAKDCCKFGGAGVAFAFGFFIERKYIKFDVRTKSVWTQILKFVCGIGPALAVYLGLKKLFEVVMVTTAQQIFGDFTRYFLLVFWLIAAYPAIFKAVQKKRAKNA